MEGVTQEAASIAGHLQLNKLIVLYDDNKITIDGSTELAFTENTPEKFRALGWQVLHVNGNEVKELDHAIETAKNSEHCPTLICCRTTIGYGSPSKAGTSKVHGSPLGAEEVILTKKALGLPENQEFWIDPAALDFFRTAVQKGEVAQDLWNKAFKSYQESFPEKGALLEKLLQDDIGTSWLEKLPTFANPIATRNASQTTLNAIAESLPTLVGGSADLAESVMTAMKGLPTMQPATPEGRNIAFGIREHAMAAMVNGFTLHGGCKAYGGTFLIFSDYCRPSLRLAALMECPSIFLFSHDSIGLGEDGPTHQPIEHIMSLRAIPNFNLMRPADGNETAACWAMALQSKKTPSAILLSRQSLPSLTPETSINHPAFHGAYILKEAFHKEPKVILVATGSEVSLAMEVGELLESKQIPSRVVSMPSWLVFENQTLEYKQKTLPQNIFTVSIEAGTTLGWSKYADLAIGIDHFGASAPAAQLMKEFGFTADCIAKKILAQFS